MGALVSAPITIGSATIRNRLYRAPVLEGAGSGPDAGERYAAAFVPNARAGVGLIIQGSSCVTEEGRTSPGMTVVDTRERMLALADMVGAVHAEGASIFLQLGHGGIFAMEAWHEPYASARRGPLLAASPVPRRMRLAFRGVPVHVLATDEVYELARRFGAAASWAREAGYDGIQLGSANAKLLDQFLSPFYNRRGDEFGGSLEGRARVLEVIRGEVAKGAGDDYPCTVKIPAERVGLGGRHLTADDCIRLCRLAEEWGFHAITPVEVSPLPDTTLSRGGIPSSMWNNPSMKTRLRQAAPSRLRRATLIAGAAVGGWRNPFSPVWNRELFRRAKAAVSIPVFAVGGIRTRDEIDSILEGGEADMVGVGRPFYAEDDLPTRLLAEAPEHPLCQNSNRCVPAQMLGMKGVCYNPAVTKARAARRAAGGTSPPAT